MRTERIIFQSFLKVLTGCLLLTACATPQSTWKTVPETNMPYDRAWGITVNTVAQHFELDTSDAQSGYLRSSWKVTNSFLGIPQRRVRVIARVEERKPFKLKLKAEKQEPNPWDANDWRLMGDDEQAATEIMEELSGRLKTVK